MVLGEWLSKVRCKTKRAQIDYSLTVNGYCMKQALLSFFFLAFLALASVSASNGGNLPFYEDPVQPVPAVYPNPAIDYIGLTNDTDVTYIRVFNMVGRPMREFKAVNGQRYDIADLPQGLYLIQLINESNQVITTQRITKR